MDDEGKKGGEFHSPDRTGQKGSSSGSAGREGLIRRIIIVEDNDNVAKIIARSLNDEGFETKVISYGSAATFYALEKNDSLLLMEYQLPDMTAKDVIVNLKESRIDVPFIIMSAPGNEKGVIEMMKLGARDYLVKEQGFLELLPTSVKNVIQQLDLEDRLAVTEQSLKQSEEKFRNIFNRITDAIFIYDFQGRILETNQATLRMLGVEERALDQLNYLEFLPEDFNKNFNLYLSELRAYKQLIFETTLIDTRDKKIPVECISRLIEYDNDSVVLTIARNITDRKQTENLLRQSEERLKRITETMTDYIYTVFVNNGEPLRTVHSSACQVITGYTPEELSNNPYLWIEMVDEQDRNLVLENVKRVLSGEQIDPYEHRIIRKDGKVAWLRNTPVLHFDETGKLTYYDGVVQDITERKRYEIELLEKQAHLNAIIKSFDGLSFVCSADRKIEFVNDKLIKKTGRNPIGEVCYRALHDRDEVCPWCVNEKVQKGETVRREIRSSKDNRWYSIVNTPIYHHDGRISKQSLVIDITESRLAEQEILRLNSLYFGLLEELNLPVCRFLKDGTIKSVNSAFQRIFVCDTDKPIENQKIFSCISEQLRNWTEKNLSNLSASNPVIRKIFKQIEISDETLYDRVWIIAAVLDQDSNVIEYQAILRDNTGPIMAGRNSVLHSS
jgi:PAS domain S-box-containing protein